MSDKERLFDGRLNKLERAYVKRNTTGGKTLFAVPYMGRLVRSGEQGKKLSELTWNYADRVVESIMIDTNRLYSKGIPTGIREPFLDNIGNFHWNVYVTERKVLREAWTRAEQMKQLISRGEEEYLKSDIAKLVATLISPLVVDVSRFQKKMTGRVVGLGYVFEMRGSSIKGTNRVTDYYDYVAGADAFSDYTKEEGQIWEEKEIGDIEL